MQTFCRLFCGQRLGQRESFSCSGGLAFFLCQALGFFLLLALDALLAKFVAFACDFCGLRFLFALPISLFAKR